MGYGFGVPDNAVIVDNRDTFDGDGEDVLAVGVVSDGLKGPARFHVDVSEYDQNEFGSYIAAVWTQRIDTNDATTGQTWDYKLFRSRFDLSTGTFETPREIFPDAASQEAVTAPNDPTYTWIEDSGGSGPGEEIFCYNRSVFFVITDKIGNGDEALNWNRLDGSFQKSGTLSGDFASRSLLISPTRSATATTEQVRHLYRHNVYGEDQGIQNRLQV